MVPRSLVLGVLLAFPALAEQPAPSAPPAQGSGQTGTSAQPTGSGPAASPAQPAPLKAVLRDLKGRSVGKVTLSETPHGVLVRGSLSGVPRGMHALHFHESGKCEPPFKTAGGHFNPTQRAHGALDPSGLHAGDLPNLVVPKSGKLQFELLASAVSLTTGPGMLLDGDGSALVLHARPDDHHTQPSGDAGDRIACAVITR